jgi:hypothetical protein
MFPLSVHPSQEWYQMAQRGRPRKIPLVIPTEASAPIEAVIDPEALPAVEFLSPTIATMPDMPPITPIVPVPQPPTPPLPPTPPNEPTELPPGWVVGKKAETLGDVFVGLTKYSTQVERVAWLRHNAAAPLWYLLNFAFSKDRVWLLPPGLPPYKQHHGRPGSSPSDLKRELRRLYLFIEGGSEQLDRIKREKLFQQTIEGLETSEVSVINAIKDRTLPETFGCTPQLVEAAFPGLLATEFPLRFIKR